MSKWIRWLQLAVFAIAPSASVLVAQGTISGRVTSDAGVPLQSASISVPALSVGAYSKDDGTFSISIPASKITGASITVTVTARRVGYAAKSVSVVVPSGGAVVQNFQLTAIPSTLTGVVVTALGVEKEKSRLGTAQQQLNTADLRSSPDQSIVNQLSGKVSGVVVTGSGTQGGSSNIRIRGSNSITGNNEPLWIVDGVPILNTNRGAGPGVTGPDFGSVINDLNPEDIASLTVLKGPNAAALYGSRAANGVIVVTTRRSGSTNGKIVTTVSTDVSYQTPGIMPSYQNTYGQGSGGQFQYVDGQGGGNCDGCDQSFGPKMDGRLIDQFTGKAQPWLPHPKNVQAFFNVGRQLNSNIAFAGGTDRASLRVAFGNENVDGMVPNSFWRKFNGSLNGTLKVNQDLTTTASIQYIRSEGLNRPGTGYNTGILEQFIWFGRQIDLSVLKAKQVNADGSLFNWNYNYHNNPYWLVYNNPEGDARDNIVGSASATYTIAPWLNVTGRQSLNLVRQNINQNWGKGNITGCANCPDPAYSGSFNLFNSTTNEMNTEVLALANKDVGAHLSFSGTAGANRRFTNANSSQIATTGISVPGIYNVTNAAITPFLANNQQARQINSVYGAASATYDGWWTVEGTARQDWSSTLPKGSNSYFYPSINTSVVLTDAIPAIRSSVLSYLKLRASTAQVGNDAGPYQLNTPYNGSSNKFAGQPLYSISNTIFNSTLKPELTRSNEVGLEMSLFDGRLTADMTYYRKSTKNQIITIPVSTASGFSNVSLNAGQVDNWGTEAIVTAKVLDHRDFSWTSTFNYGQNRGSVVALTPGLLTFVMGSQWSANVEARVGQQLGVLFGNSIVRDSATGLPITSNGFLQSGARKVLGGVNPTWIGGWSNTVRYKWFTVGALLDTHVGGKFFSISEMMGQTSGVLSETMWGRTADWNDPGIVVNGIDAKTKQKNTVNVNPEDYFQNLFLIHEAFIYDASFVKLREIHLTFDFPSEWAHRYLRSQAVSCSVVGRNVASWTKVPNFDPEFAYSTGNAQGMEFATIPNPKSVGFSMRVTP
jgi:TonB-linked SusC/RagA family outer membrane protein